MSNNEQPSNKDAIEKSTKETIEKLKSAELKKEVKKDSHLIDSHKIKK